MASDIGKVHARSELAVGAFVAATLGLGVWLEPRSGTFTPELDEIVLERLPTRSARDEAQLSAPERITRARAAIALARRDGDPRPLGRAESWLAPLLGDHAVPGEAHVLYATILQARHEFVPAIRELDRVLERSPDAQQARLLRASILAVLGRGEEAVADCTQLHRSAASVMAGCRALALGSGGEAATALSEVDAALRAEHDRSVRAWLLSLRGELSYWYESDLDTALASLAEALALAPGDRYTRALYADVALDSGDHERARVQLGTESEDDALLLRRMLAESGSRRLALERELERRFEESRERGDRVHQREEARFRLAQGDAQAALRLAKENFGKQREPWDVRVLVEAARRANDSAALAEVRAWMEETGLRSPRLAGLLDTELGR